MEEQIKTDNEEVMAERVKQYQAAGLLSDIESRIFSIRWNWMCATDFRRTGETALASGAVRFGLDAAIGLAATPATTREYAVWKVAALHYAIRVLDQEVVAGSLIDASPMLAAAAEVEVKLWRLPTSADPRKIEGMKQLSDITVSPVMRRHYLELAEPQDFAAALAYVGSVLKDLDGMRQRDDTRAEVGAIDTLVVAVLRVLATSAQSLEELECKQRLLVDQADLLSPVVLLRPMLDAVLMADCGRVHATLEQIVKLQSVLPHDDG